MEENRAGIFEEENVVEEGYVEEEILEEENLDGEAYDEEADGEYIEEEAEEDLGEEDEINYNELENAINLFGYLKTELTEHSVNVPLGKSKRIVDVDRCLSMIDDIISVLPRAFRYCWRTRDEKDRILGTAEMHAANRIGKAKEDAERILDEAHEQEEKILAAAQRRHNNTINDAKARAEAILQEASERAKRMVSETTIVKNATAEANRLLNEADTDARECRLHAAHDAYRLFDAFEKQAANITTAISRRKNELGVNNKR